jgi:hypothetical protein
VTGRRRSFSRRPARGHTAPPADFSLRYTWRAGTLPPPYHYDYRIVLHADGSGKMIMVPNYPAPDVPMWEESFIIVGRFGGAAPLQEISFSTLLLVLAEWRRL